MEKERQAQAPNNGDKGKARVVEHVPPSAEPERDIDEKPQEPISRSAINDSSKSMNHRLPPPAFNVEEDERALNAAAAREFNHTPAQLPPPEHPSASPCQLGATVAFTKSSTSLRTAPIRFMGARMISVAAFKSAYSSESCIGSVSRLSLRESPSTTKDFFCVSF
ncbi:hypothetical protein GALMADRAFT_138887 [Galerina marginata CBS 339.88]|uniref:Uncharacterized protein n=1 Tax=Galerina marginata (strain CBS 339.88) TaxID=685588 RepID=A0A067T3Y5_GALM3|nr:hypothetical protein GALMADRAFT_138887 [Galerina marginata CBS 339.88]